MTTSTGSGQFLVLEGIDGAGKTTQAKRLVQALTDLGISAIYTREPGGTTLAEQLRNTILNPVDESISPTTELLVMFAARQQHLDHVIRPALARGTWVVCDRFTDSSYAYQVAGRQQDPALFNTLMEHVVDTTRPDLTLFLNLPESVYQQRLKDRVVDNNRLDRESSDFYQRARDAFRDRSHQVDHCVVDANQSMDAVSHDILAQLQCRYSQLQSVVI